MNGHGGARPGAGRKKADKDSTQVTWRVSTRAKNWIREQSMTQGVSTAVILDQLIDSFEEDIA